MLARAARPKLSLTVPTTPSLSISVPTAVPMATLAPRSPISFLAPTTFNPSTMVSTVAPAASPISAMLLTPTTTRNTLFNARGLATLHVPSQLQSGVFAEASRHRRAKKRVQFSDEESVRCVSPMPEEYYGEYAKMSREERRWGRK